MTKRSEPAWGERNAVTGYYSQYRVSAALVIRALREGSLSWIAVADPKAGRVDDFQIANDQRVDAYQFKWSRYGGTVSFNDLIRVSESAPSLIRQLADGWKRLRATYRGQRVVVHLTTNQQPSTSDQPPVGHPAPDTKHFAAFVEQVLKPAHSAANPAEFTVPAPWQTTWEALQRASGLDDLEFKEFVRDCELEFGRTLPTIEGLSSRDAEIYAKDLDHVTQRIFAAVFDPQHVVRLSREELLNRLGWKDRFEYRNRHSFPVNEALYQPIDESREALERAVNELDGGYIGVLGTPGSGKSTLLTQTLRYFPQRVIRYYAYIPDAQAAAVRGEAVNFLNDIVRALEDAGFRPGQSISYPDHEQLRERLHEQLRLLHQDWRETGRKTIILVDGLDHIPREQRPTHSLLRDLPPPDQIPQGIYFVLGSQTDQLEDLPNSVQFAIRQPERRIEMDNLSREAVRRIIERADLTRLLSPEQMDRMYELSAGHPLALIYLLQELEGVGDQKAVERMLRDAPPYRGSIEEQYFGYWRQIDEDDELAELLGVISRMRGVIDLQWIESWSSATVVRRLRRKFAHLFRAEDHSRWYFFHNSFRLYLNERTAESAPGVFDPAKDRALHHELAVKCRQSSEPRWRWEEIYQLYRAKADDELLKRARPDFFRHQFLNFRSAESIRTDIILALRAAGRRRDVISLVRLLLTDAEMAQREANTESLLLTPSLLSLGDAQAAIEHLRDGQRLRVKPENALRNSVVLLKHGLEKEARQLFDLAEPLEHLSGAKAVDRHGREDEEHHRLTVWADSAVHFRSTDKIIAAIRRVRIEPDRFARRAQVGDDQSLSVVEVNVDKGSAQAEADAKTLFLQNTMLLRAGSELIEEMRWEDLGKIEEALVEQGTKGEDWWFVLRARGWRACQAVGDLARAQRFLAETAARVDRTATTDRRCVVIAEGLFRIAENEEQARLWLQGVQPLSLQRVPDFNFTFSEFDHLFRYARLLYALGEQRRPVEMIPDPPETRHQGWAYFERGVCTIARIWAQNWKGRTLDRATIKQETFSLLRLFYHSWHDRKWESWYSLTRLKSEFYELLVNAVSLHGPDALQSLAEDFVKEWDSNSNYWSSNAIRDITIALYTAGIGGDWANEQLERVERLIANDEVLPRVEEEVKQVDAWLTLGKLDRAKESLKQALLDSSSIGSKDYQLGEWIKWMARANKLEPEGVPERIGWFAQAVADLERNGGPSKDAAYDLLEVAFEWSPRRAVRLFCWLSQRGLIDFDDAVRALLRAALASSANSSTYVAMILIEFLLPVSDVDNDLVQLLVNRLFEKLGRDGVIEFAREFNSALEKHSLPSNRRSWRSSLAKSLQARGVDISVAGLGGEDLVHKKDRGTDDGLTLKDGTNLPTDEVIEKASTVDGLRELVQQQAGHFYHWDEVIANLAPKLEKSAEVMEVVSFFSARGFSARTLIKLAERLRELGDADHARQVANDALVGSETSGWAVQLSGGTKIAAYQVLTAMDGEQARDQAFKSLVEDMTGTFRYPGYIVQNLDEILPLLITKVPEKEIWKEIEPYVHSLFPGVGEKNQESGLLDVLRATPDADTPVRALIELLQLHIAHPIKLLSNSAQTVFIKLLIKEEPILLDVMRQLMKGSEAEQESALMVLDAASSRNSDVASGFEDALRELSESPNFALRVVANRVSQRIGVSLPIVHSGRVAASSIYQLSLPPSRETDTVWDDSERTAFDFLPETDNPHELLKIQMVYFNWMAARTGLPLENLIQRAAQIVRELTQEDEWAKQGEKWLRNRFNVVGLRYTYIRPRATIARRAFFHVAAELADAGKLKAEDFQEMNSAFDYFDPDMFFVKPVARPNFVFPMPGGRFREDFASPPTCGGTDGVPSLQTDDGLIIFGEYTKIKRLEWETPTIIRQSVIGIERPDESEGRHSFFKRTSFCLIQNYHKLNVTQSSSNSLVIRHELRAYDSPGPEWMALNPALARSIGWTPVDESLFGWADDSGRLMVWSIWWQDGLYQPQPPKFDDDVGEGWVVVGLPEALDAVTAHIGGQLKQFIRLEQSEDKNGQRKTELRFEEFILDEHILQTSN